jgi:PKD repeat protein
VDSSPAIADGVVYVGSYDNMVYAIYAANGTQKWAFTTGSFVDSSPAVVDGVVYVGSYDNMVYAIYAANGTQKWAFTTGSYVLSSPAVVDGVVYVGSYDDKVYAIGFLPPVANFTATPTSGTVPLTVTFTDLSTNNPTSWNWSFGDGTFNETQNTVHTYASAGTYTVTLTALNAGGSNTSPGTTITVTVPPPVADFTATPTSGTAPLPVTFTDLSTNNPTSWNWSFGDTGWFNTSSAGARNATHTYTSPGTYTVMLSVTNPSSTNSKTETDYISVIPPIPTTMAPTQAHYRSYIRIGGGSPPSLPTVISTPAPVTESETTPTPSVPEGETTPAPSVSGMGIPAAPAGTSSPGFEALWAIAGLSVLICWRKRLL